MNVTKKPVTKRRPLTPFGKLSREMRLAAGISQGELARMANVSAGYVGLIETGSRGARPSLDVVKRFAWALNASFDETEDLMKAAGWLLPHQSLSPLDRPSTLEVISGDPYLSDRQKEILLAMYDQLIRHKAG